jgi:hypothetical protein
MFPLRRLQLDFDPEILCESVSVPAQVSSIELRLGELLLDGRQHALARRAARLHHRRANLCLRPAGSCRRAAFPLFTLTLAVFSLFFSFVLALFFFIPVFCSWPSSFLLFGRPVVDVDSIVFTSAPRRYCRFSFPLFINSPFSFRHENIVNTRRSRKSPLRCSAYVFTWPVSANETASQFG